MIEILKELTRNLVLLLLLATFLEMLLPKSDLARYIRLVVGLFVLLTILHPVMELFDWEGNVTLPIREPPPEHLDVLINQGIQLGESRQATALKVAEERLEKQVEAMLYLVQGIDEVRVDLTLDSHRETGPVITQALVFLTPHQRQEIDSNAQIAEVETVVIGPQQSTSATLSGGKVSVTEDRHRLVERVANGVSAYLGIARSQIQVDLAEH